MTISRGQILPHKMPFFWGFENDNILSSKSYTVTKSGISPQQKIRSLQKKLLITSYPSFRWGDISLFVTMYDFDLRILSFLKPQKKRHFVRQNLPPRNCQSNYFIWYSALDIFYLINKKNGLKIPHFLASHEWVE